jgi:hypothetical protein
LTEKCEWAAEILTKMDGRRKMNQERIAELIFIIESQHKMRWKKYFIDVMEFH